MRQIDLVTVSADEREKFTEVVNITTENLIRAERIPVAKSRERFERARDTTLANAKETNFGHSEARRRDVESNDQVRLDMLEAIVLEKYRPAWFIENDKIQIVENNEIGEYPDLKLLKTKKKKIEKAVKSVGRVDLFYHSKEFVGTGWLIEEDIVVTNAHVAEEFCRLDRFSGWVYQTSHTNDPVETRLDTLRQRNTRRTGNRRVELLDILYVGQSGGGSEPDIAFFKVADNHNLQPLELDIKPYRDRVPVGVIGYPAWDDRNDEVLMRRLFGVEYNVKRFMPGYINSFDDKLNEYLGDYTTLGGVSGAPVVSLDNLKVVGLHFAGLFRMANYSVPSDIVLSALGDIRKRIKVTESPRVKETVTASDQFTDRKGYDPEFLGQNDLKVPIPDLGGWVDDVASVSDDDNDILKYTHFSIIQSKSRRLPLLTAVNIDGAKSVRVKRGHDKWCMDGRLENRHQIGNTLYVRNDLDRGHLVRRLDPVWGETPEIAKQAEIDTFHYTNSAPQHKSLNRYIWLGLEDYILEAASTKDFKVSVFTGPIFRDDDRTLSDQPGAEDVPIPQEYWKIAVMVNSQTQTLSATAYVLSQGDFIRDMTETAFIFGQYKVYQVQVKKVEAKTGLDFGLLRDRDPLAGRNESRFGDAAIQINSAIDLSL